MKEIKLDDCLLKYPVLIDNVVMLIKDIILNDVPSEWTGYESVICEPIQLGTKFMKILKRGWKNLLKNPSILFKLNRSTIKLHFDMHHGYGNLDKAINLLDDDDRIEFKNFVNQNTKFNPHIMFITRPKIINKWFSKLFPWLEKCEKIFGFENLKGFGLTRIYTFLAERFMSYWFQKNSKNTTMPIVFYDIRNDIK